MPWKESSVVEERARFVLEYERGLCSMAELAEDTEFRGKPVTCGCGVTRQKGAMGYRITTALRIVPAIARRLLGPRRGRWRAGGLLFQRTMHALMPTILLRLNYSRALGTKAFSAQRAESFHFLLLPSPPLVYQRHKPKKLRVSLGARAAQLQASRLRLRSHAGACSPSAQRTTTGHASRCAEIIEARSSAAFDWRCGAFLAEAVLRFQLPAVWRKAALTPDESSSQGPARIS